MRSSALLERFRMALEVIANGPEWEPGTVTARLALMPPEVSADVRAIKADIETYVEPSPYEGMSVREAVERRLAEDRDLQWLPPEVHAEADAASEPAPDLEREPTSQPELDNNPEPEGDDEADEKPGRVREKVGEDGLTDTQRAILEFIRERCEVDTGMIREAIPGVTYDKLKRGLRILKGTGLILTRGDGPGRTFIPAPVDEKPKPAPAPVVEVEDAGRTDGYTLSGMHAVQAEAARNGPGSEEGRVLEAVKYRPRWTIEQHAQRLDLPVDRVAVAMRKLEEEFEVQSMASNGRVAWVIR